MYFVADAGVWRTERGDQSTSEYPYVPDALMLCGLLARDVSILGTDRDGGIQYLDGVLDKAWRMGAFHVPLLVYPPTPLLSLEAVKEGYFIRTFNETSWLHSMHARLSFYSVLLFYVVSYPGAPIRRLSILPAPLSEMQVRRPDPTTLGGTTLRTDVPRMNSFRIRVRGHDTKHVWMNITRTIHKALATETETAYRVIQGPSP